jgi:TadE-like protein
MKPVMMIAKSVDVQRDQSRECAEWGAAMVEFAIAFPVLVFFILGFIDFSRFLTYQAALDRAASQTLMQAQTDPDIELEDGPEFDAAINALKLLAQEKVTQMGIASSAAAGSNHASIWLSAEPDIQIPSGGVITTAGGAPITIDSIERMEGTPIRISLSATMQTFIPQFIGQVSMTGEAIGYRELIPRFRFPRAICAGVGGNGLGARQITEGATDPSFGAGCG